MKNFTYHPVRIHMKDIELSLLIGAYKKERLAPQRIVMNFRYELDGAAAAGSDNLKDTVDYVDIVGEIRKKAEGTSFYLLESFVKFALDIIMAQPRVIWAEVEADKPDAPIDAIRSVSVTLSARRGK